MARTGIICTIGPASETPDTLQAMITAGMDVVRLNFSHGKREDHQKRIDTLRSLDHQSTPPVAILQDLEGFRIRIGEFENNPGSTIELTKDETVTLSNQTAGHDSKVIPMDYSGPLDAIKPGDYIYIDDGNIALEVTESADTALKCKVITGGSLKEHKGVNIPDARIPFESLSEKDRLDIQFGIKNNVDFIAQSFVRNRQDIADIRDIIDESNFSCKLIAKIENCDGIHNLDEIMDVSDGIMVARGDLGVSVPIYRVPMLQKMIIRKCRQQNKLVITATQMLESMTENLRPTRAEVSDVANAVLDGSDYVMLSGETAIGKYPVETIAMMQKTIDYTEETMSSKQV